MLRRLVTVLLLSQVGCIAMAGAYPYHDPKEPVDARVADLLKRMTLDEKVAQLTYVGSVDSSAIPHALANGGVGGLNCPHDATTCVNLTNAVQHALKTKTRLGIPASVNSFLTEHLLENTGGLLRLPLLPNPSDLSVR